MGNKEIETKSGTIVRTFSEKGYGFIQGEGGQSIFFHATGVIEPRFQELKEGDKVEYLNETTAKGDKAIKVVKV